MTKSIFVVGLNPVIQKTIILPYFKEDGVVRAQSCFTDASGKAVNVCRVLAQLGLKSKCLTPVGRANGEEFIKLAAKDNLKIIPVDSPVRIRNCYTLLNIEKGTASEVIVDEPEKVGKDIERKTAGIFFSNIYNMDILILTGSRARGFSDSIIPAMIKEAKEAGAEIFADYRENDLLNSLISREIRPDYVKINFDELKATFPGEFSQIKKNSLIKEKLREISDRYNNTFIITNGKKETIFAGKGQCGIIKPQPVRAFNHIGCGDSFLAGLVYSFIKGSSVYDAVIKAGETATANALNYRPGSIIS